MVYRKDVIARLEAGAVSLSQLARELDTDPRTLKDELEHVRKTLARQGRQLDVQPAECRKCGFAFDRNKLTKPGKCPQCRGTWIAEPIVSIRNT